MGSIRWCVACDVWCVSKTICRVRERYVYVRVRVYICACVRVNVDVEDHVRH